MKSKLLLCSIIFISYLLSSCNKGDNPKPTNDANSHASQSNLVNKWWDSYIWSVSFDSAGVKLGEGGGSNTPAPDSYMEFMANLTCNYYYHSKVFSGNYSINNNILTVKFDPANPYDGLPYPKPVTSITYKVDSLSQQKLVLRDTVYYSNGHKTIYLRSYKNKY